MRQVFKFFYREKGIRYADDVQNLLPNERYSVRR